MTYGNILEQDLVKKLKVRHGLSRESETQGEGEERVTDHKAG